VRLKRGGKEKKKKKKKKKHVISSKTHSHSQPTLHSQHPTTRQAKAKAEAEAEAVSVGSEVAFFLRLTLRCGSVKHSLLNIKLNS
jgi:hypothetical protein